MNYHKTLKNNNKIIFNTSYDKRVVHTASDLTIRCVFSGTEKCSIGNRDLLIYPDSFLVLNKGTQFNSVTNSDIPVQSFTIAFAHKFVSDFYNSWQLKDSQLLEGQSADKPLFNKQARQLSETLFPFQGDIKFTLSHLKHHLTNGLNDELLINEYLHHCLINYFRLCDEQIFKKVEQLNFLNSSTKIEVLRRLNLAKEYLYSNFDQNIDLEELSAYSCLSVNHLLRTFKQAFGQSPHQFLVDIRLRRARQLLRTTQQPINEIVNAIGFECPSSFTRLFKRHFYVTPVNYRQSA